jgi:MFS transporter, DHA1 family, multidrug resistance protein
MEAMAPAEPSFSRPAQPSRLSPTFVALLGSMTALGAFTTDTYLPSLPAVGLDLGASPAATQLTISGTLIGAALGQLVIGPLSDRFGRRRPALIGITVHIVASLLCVVAPGIVPLIGLRVMQGVGNSAAGVVAMAVIRDRYVGSTAARVISRLMLIIGAAPLFAPSIGGLIAGVWGWRAVFVALALLGVGIGLLVLRWLPETLAVERRQAAGLRGALRGYRALLRDRHFVALAVLPGLGQATLMSYVAGSPYVLRQGFGLSANQFALLFAINGVGLVGGAQVNGWLVYRMAPIRILRLMIPMAIGLAVALLLIARAGTGGLIGLLVPLWFLLAINGFVAPNASALALSRHGERAGTAAAMIGSLQVGLAGAVIPLVGLVGQDAAAMTSVMLGCLVAALAVLAFATPAYRRGGWTGV